MRSLVQVNPAELNLRSPNAILSGRSRRYFVPDFDGPFSIKAVVEGSAVWQTHGARHRVASADILVLNHGQRYSITIDSSAPVETFCLFFEERFVAKAHRALTATDVALLDDPELPGAAIEFVEAVLPEPRILPLIHQLRQAVRAGADANALESGFHVMARALLLSRADVRRQLRRLPAQRNSTRVELYRRLQCARSLADESREALDIGELAQAACLSVHHFHRSFTRLFGESPHSYAVRKRLGRAASLLRASDAPVQEVAQSLGFVSVGSFTSLFRRHYGLPPANWRKKQD